MTDSHNNTDQDTASPKAVRQRLAWAAFLALLALQAAWSSHLDNDSALQPSPGGPPGVMALRVASLDEPQFAGYATSLYIQGFDAQAGALLALRAADTASICAWLERAFELNPHSGYPLMLASFDYAEPAHARDEIRAARADASASVEESVAPKLLDFVERAYAVDPARHWRWLAHASWLAHYVLHDSARAMREARLLRDAPASASVPRWARELDSFVLRRQDPQEAQEALLGGLAFASPADQKEIDRLAARLAHPLAAPAATWGPASGSRPLAEGVRDQTGK